jgi:membrane protein
VGAQAVAFKVIVTFIPVVILASGLIGQFLQGEEPFMYVENVIREFLPAYQSDSIIAMIRDLQDVSGTLTIVGVVGLILAAVTLFTTLRTVFENIFQEEWHGQRSLLKGYMFDLRMVVQVGVFFILSVVLTILLQTLDESGIIFLNELGIDIAWIREGWRGIFTSTGKLIPFLLSAMVFFQLYYFIPMPRSRIRSALIGAVVTAAAWEVAKIAYTEYATGIGGFEQGWFISLGDTFLLVFATIFWAYYSGIILSIGAIITLLHERRYRMLRLEKDSGMIHNATQRVHASDSGPNQATG